MLTNVVVHVLKPLDFHVSASVDFQKVMQIRKAIEICNKMHVRNIDPYLTEKNELKNMLRKTQIKKAVVVGDRR